MLKVIDYFGLNKKLHVQFNHSQGKLRHSEETKAILQIKKGLLLFF